LMRLRIMLKKSIRQHADILIPALNAIISPCAVATN
jgi:hypothetical protein